MPYFQVQLRIILYLIHLHDFPAFAQIPVYDFLVSVLLDVVHRAVFGRFFQAHIEITDLSTKEAYVFPMVTVSTAPCRIRTGWSSGRRTPLYSISAEILCVFVIWINLQPYFFFTHKFFCFFTSDKSRSLVVQFRQKCI